MNKLILFLALLAMPFAFAQDMVTPSNLAYAGTLNKCVTGISQNSGIQAGYVLKLTNAWMQSPSINYNNSTLTIYSGSGESTIIPTPLLNPYTNTNNAPRTPIMQPVWARGPVSFTTYYDGSNPTTVCLSGIIFKEIPIVTP